MKLLGRTNGKQVIASISHYDYVSVGEGDDYISADGGQILTNHHAGHTKGWGRVVWFEVSQNFAELFNDYQFRSTASGVLRKYGIWNIEDVKILDESEYPDIESIEEKSKCFCWGTNGADGKEKLKYVLLKDCDLDHLQNILKNVSHVHPETKEVIEYLIAEKSEKQS